MVFYFGHTNSRQHGMLLRYIHQMLVATTRRFEFNRAELKFSFSLEGETHTIFFFNAKDGWHKLAGANRKATSIVMPPGVYDNVERYETRTFDGKVHEWILDHCDDVVIRDDEEDISVIAFILRETYRRRLGEK